METSGSPTPEHLSERDRAVRAIALGSLLGVKLALLARWRRRHSR